MVLTEQSERVAQAKERLAKKEIQKVEDDAKAERDASKPKVIYNKDSLVQLTSAIIATDRTTLLNIPALITKAKQVLDEINRL